MTYQVSDDQRYIKNLREGAPDALKAFLQFDQAVFDPQTGTLPIKTRELVAIAVALTTQCPYCIEAHTKAAKKAGATEAEVAEVSMIASVLRAGAGFAHGWLAMKMFQDD